MRILLPISLLAALVIGGTGCASSHSQTGYSIVRPGPYAGVRTDLALIGWLAQSPKNFRGSEKVIVALCAPVGATLVAADIPLSLVADTCRLVTDIGQQPVTAPASVAVTASSAPPRPQADPEFWTGSPNP